MKFFTAKDMRRINPFAITALAFLLLLWSCKPTDPPATLEDTKAPWIVMTSPMPVELGEGWVYLKDGQPFPIDIRFEDDVELDKYKIQIKYNKRLNYLKTQNDAWEKIEVGFLDGKSDGFNTTWNVHSDPNAGPYEFIVTVWDKEGKESTVTTYLLISNQRDTIPPTAVFTKPSPAMVDTIWGDTLYVKGTLQDNLGVKDAYLRLRTADSVLIEGSEVYLDTLFAGVYNFDTFLTIHAAAPGEHIVEVYAHDAMENVGKASVKVFVK